MQHGRFFPDQRFHADDQCHYFKGTESGRQLESTSKSKEGSIMIPFNSYEFTSERGLGYPHRDE
jgi:hypothetical protein